MSPPGQKEGLFAIWYNEDSISGQSKGWTGLTQPIITIRISYDWDSLAMLIQTTMCRASDWAALPHS